LRIGFHGGGVITVFSKSAPSLFASIKLLGHPTRDELHAVWYNVINRIQREQVNMVLRRKFSKMPDMAGQKISVRAGHGPFSLNLFILK